ncbi:MAG: hypothetical protein ACREBR_03765 [bacterium]
MHILGIFTMWKETGTYFEKASITHFSPPHDLICLEALIASIIAFLRFCPDLLLKVLDALSTTTFLLEGLLPLVASDGRLGGKRGTPASSVRLESVKASFLEAFSWMPPGSYPLAADQLFCFAMKHIEVSLCIMIQGLVGRGVDSVIRFLAVIYVAVEHRRVQKQVLRVRFCLAWLRKRAKFLMRRLCGTRQGYTR